MIRRIPAPKSALGGEEKSAQFLPKAEFEAETKLSFYFGWRDVGGTSRIERQDRRSLTSEYFNGAVAEFDQDWDNRETLEYG